MSTANTGNHESSDDDMAEMRVMAGHVRTVTEAYLVEWWGERCPDFNKDCECCKRWKALDVLLEMP